MEHDRFLITQPVLMFRIRTSIKGPVHDTHMSAEETHWDYYTAGSCGSSQWLSSRMRLDSGAVHVGARANPITVDGCYSNVTISDLAPSGLRLRTFAWGDVAGPKVPVPVAEEGSSSWFRNRNCEIWWIRGSDDKELPKYWLQGMASPFIRCSAGRSMDNI